MITSTFKKTAVATALAGTFAAGASAPAEAIVINLDFRGAYTFLNPTGAPIANLQSDYVGGYYANGDSYYTTFGPPIYPANLGPGAIGPYGAPFTGAYKTASGWYGDRTPISGTMSFDTSTGAGVGTFTPFMFFGDVPGAGGGTNPARHLATFATIDTVGTMIGSLFFTWAGSYNSVSVVLDASGLFGGVGGLLGGGPTTSLSGVGTMAATENLNFGSLFIPKYNPLGPLPIATKTNDTGAGCNGLTLATVSGGSIVRNNANILTCTTGMGNDGVGGSPMTSPPFPSFNANFDITSVHLAAVPVPAAVWLFGSGLLGLIGLARRKKAD